MPGISKTHLYCYDDHRGFSEDVRKRFADISKYTVVSFQTREEFISRLEKDKLSNFCKVAILGVHDTKEQLEMIDQLTKEIKKMNPDTGLILLGPPDRMETIRKTVKFNIDAYVPKNANTVLRVHNAVKKLMSQHSIGLLRKKSQISLYILLGFILVALGMMIAAHFKLPQYF